MPMSPPRLCTTPNCPGRIQAGVCSVCGPKRRARDTRKGSTARGYDYRWQQFRLTYIAEHPLCVDCEAEGIVGPATDIHHERKLADHPEAKYDERYLKALCVPHHSKRTARGE